MSAPGPRTPTQQRYPWRAALRTGLSALIALASLLPLIFAGVDVPAGGMASQVLAVAVFINRLMLIPGVNEWLTSIGLGPTPPK